VLTETLKNVSTVERIIIGKLEVYLMKDSRVQKIIITTLIIGLLTISTYFSVSNSFVKQQPPTEGEWVISGDETIVNQNIIINGSISVQYGGSLTIINSTVAFKANKTDSFSLKVSGELYVESSNLTVTNILYNFSLSGDPGAIIDISDSRIEYAFISFKNAHVVITGSTFFNYYELVFDFAESLILTGNTFEHSTVEMKISRIQTVLFAQNALTNLQEGLLISDAKNGSVEHNVFDTIQNTALYVKNNVELNITWNNFGSVDVGTYVDNSAVNLFYNNFQSSNKSLVLDDGDKSLIRYNNFTDIFETIIYTEQTKESEITDNSFVDGLTGIEITTSEMLIKNNYFRNLSEAVIGIESDLVNIIENTFIQMRKLGVEFSGSWDTIVEDNTFSDLPVGIDLTGVRRSTIQNNTLTNVDEGIGIIASREVSLLGNTIENTITGIYLEQSKDIVATANGAINATYGITLWSMSNALLASNGVFESIYALSIWFSDNIRVVGNELSTSEIGIISRSTTKLLISNGIYNLLDYGIQIVGSFAPKIIGNTFDNITNEAITLIDSDNFLVYYNNFKLNASVYADIINCLGSFNYQVDNETIAGNYFAADTSGNRVYIDTVTIGSVSVDIYDEHPLTKPFTVKPTVEFISRDITNPTDQDEVTIITQIFVPEQMDIHVYIEYTLNLEETWNEIDITSSETPVGSIGAINQYQGTIPAYPYNYIINYRLKITYTEESQLVVVTTDNETYTVATSEYTPIIIYEPEVHVITVNEDNQEVTVKTSDFYEGYDYIVMVRIENRTDIGLFEGNRYVNITYTETDPFTNETESFSALMEYNATLNRYIYDFGKTYDVGARVDYFIIVMDSNGTFYRTVFNYTIEITTPPEATGFDAITLLSIGGTLVLVQAIVVIRRRRKNRDVE